MPEAAPPSVFDSLASALDWAASRLRAAGVDNPRLEARLLAAHAAGQPLAELLARRAEPFPAEPFASLVERRAGRMPLAYLTGVREFWSLPLVVSPATLIPRPESESVVAAALDHFPDRPGGRVLDLGTGTGALLLAVLSERREASGIGTDRIAEAALLAARNAASLGLAERAFFVCCDWAAAIAGRFDLVLSNPPYVRTDELAELMPEVARHEPRSALDGGPDGLASYSLIFADLPRLLAPGGVAVLELGPAEGVAGLARASGLKIEIGPDLAGTHRVAICSRPEG